MAEFADRITMLIKNQSNNKVEMIADIIKFATQAGYSIADVDDTKPWGGYVRFDYKDGDRFISEFFPDINPEQARLGIPDAELSPKILLVEPKQRLSWQVHGRRAERWKFLNEGGYHKSTNADDPGNLIEAQAGDEVQFEAGECHRLVGAEDTYTFVAEIWQHSDKNNPSDEADITRLQDDYQR